jgi:hypothetical protein
MRTTIETDAMKATAPRKNTNATAATEAPPQAATITRRGLAGE